MPTTLAGPNIQMPAAQSHIGFIDPQNKTLAVSLDWAAFFHSMQQTTFNISRSGPTGSRPTSNLDGRYIGMPFYDTSLGIPIFLHSVNPDVWHSAAGAVV